MSSSSGSTRLTLEEAERQFLAAVPVVSCVVRQLLRSPWRSAADIVLLQEMLSCLRQSVVMARAQDNKFWHEVVGELSVR